MTQRGDHLLTVDDHGDQEFQERFLSNHGPSGDALQELQAACGVTPTS